MTPKEKAVYIFNKFYGIPLYIKTIRECCQILVDEMMKVTLPSSDFGGEVNEQTIDRASKLVVSPSPPATEATLPRAAEPADAISAWRGTGRKGS